MNTKISAIRKGAMVIFLSGILLVPPLALAQEQSQTYSGFNRFTDNVKLFFSGGDSKVRLAMEIREKEVDSALENAKNGKDEEATKNLERAQDKLKIIQGEISLNTSEEVKVSVEKIKEKISKDNLPEEFNTYKLEEEKTEQTAELTEETFKYCTELANDGYDEMLKEKICNPATAQKGLEDKLIELKDVQAKSFVQLMLDIRSCIDDPGTCSCDEIVEVGQKTRCEQLTAMAIKCEYSDDDASCNELESMKPTPGDGLAISFVPDFLINLFSDKRDMVEYNIEHSDGVPEECWDSNNKPECEQYDYLKETRLDWDEYGNFIGANRARGIQEPVPTIQKSIPQCYDEKNNFLEEKCGKVTIVRNEEGLVNYITEKEAKNIVDKFENVLGEQNIDINGKEGQTTINEMKEKIDSLEEQINEKVFAPGTQGIGEAKNDIQNNVIKEGSGGGGDDGFKSEVKTNVDSGNGNGNDGFIPEIKTDIDSGGNNGGGGLKSEVKVSIPENNTSDNDSVLSL